VRAKYELCAITWFTTITISQLKSHQPNRSLAPTHINKMGKQTDTHAFKHMLRARNLFSLGQNTAYCNFPRLSVKTNVNFFQ